METLERFQQSSRVVEDFTRRSLAAIPSAFGRLIYVSSLRGSDGRYRHDGLAALYADAAVQLALEDCHEELFARVLETPLSEQEWDLRISLAALEGESKGILRGGASASATRNSNRAACRTTFTVYLPRISGCSLKWSARKSPCVEPLNHSDDLAHDIGFLRQAPHLRFARR